MILQVFYHRTTRYGANSTEVAAVLDEIFSSNNSDYVDIAKCALIESSENPISDSRLWAGLNPDTGYGGLIWFATDDRARNLDDEVAQEMWVSDNPNPPQFDPDVMSDPGYPLFFDPRSTLPIDQVRNVIEEFFRAGTGDRPEGTAWVEGDMAGQRK
jgi:hypothetical protein